MCAMVTLRALLSALSYAKWMLNVLLAILKIAVVMLDVLSAIVTNFSSNVFFLCICFIKGLL